MVVVIIFLICMVIVTSVVVVIVMSVASHHNMEFKVCRVCESVFSFSFDVERHVAHWGVFPGIDVFDEVFEFARIEQSVAVHIRFVEHFHEHFFLMLIVCIMTVFLAVR